jgi:cytochrome c2
VQSDPETAPGALAPRPGSTSLAEYDEATLTGGAGLFDHSARDPFSASAGLMAGLGALVLTAVVAAVLFSMNARTFEGGKAGGTPNQLGAAVVAGAGPALAPGSPAAEGAQILATKPCGSCHTIPGIAGATGTIGPNLAGVAGRPKIAGGAVNNSGPDDLKKWITDPPALKPGTLMPKIPMTDDETTKIAAFLETLK